MMNSPSFSSRASVRFSLENNRTYFFNRDQNVEKGLIECVCVNVEEECSRCFNNDGHTKPTNSWKKTYNRWGDIAPTRDMPQLPGRPTNNGLLPLPNKASESMPRLPARRPTTDIALNSLRE
jgi:hypothetical protein